MFTEPAAAAFLADKAPADLRPGAILRQGIQPDVDQTIAAAVTLDVASYMAVREPFRRAPWRIVAGHVARLFYESGIDTCANESDAEPNAQIINPLGIGTSIRYRTS
jgi:hypothetical protein